MRMNRNWSSVSPTLFITQASDHLLDLLSLPLALEAFARGIVKRCTVTWCTKWYSCHKTSTHGLVEQTPFERLGPEPVAWERLAAVEDAGRRKAVERKYKT